MPARLVLTLVMTASVVSSCGGSSSSAAGSSSTTAADVAKSTTVSASASSGGSVGLRQAARSWANAYLTGTADEMTKLQGPECLSGNVPTTPSNERLAATELKKMRAHLQQYMGIAPTAIKIIGVHVRNVTTTTGEAEVQYDLPRSVVGNDNWVTYELKEGAWKVADCHAPIGGNSKSASVTITTAAP